MDRELIVLIGISGSGKTTKRNELLADPRYQNYSVYSLDELRLDFFERRNGRPAKDGNEAHAYFNEHEDDFNQMANARWNNLVKSPVLGIIADNTNLTHNRRYRYIEAARAHGYKLRAIVMNTSMSKCLDRQLGRDAPVPLTSLAMQYDALKTQSLHKDFHVVEYVPNDAGMVKPMAYIKAGPDFNLYDPEQLREWVEANPKLVKMRYSTRYPDLRVLKYQPRCMYENLWDYAAIEMRGLVIDRDWNIVVHPFTKMDYEGTPLGSVPATRFADDQMLEVGKKFNGFMGAVTKTSKYGTIYSTTGSLDSEFCDMIKEYVPEDHHMLIEGATVMFEICHPKDPHVVPEDAKAYWLGTRPVAYTNTDGSHDMNTFPDFQVTAKTLRTDLMACRHEGFVARAQGQDGAPIVKFKSRYYAITKSVGRCKPENLNRLLNDLNGMKNKYGADLEPAYLELRDRAGEIKAVQNEDPKVAELERMALIRSILDSHSPYKEQI